jgi:hypothetical protein
MFITRAYACACAIALIFFSFSSSVASQTTTPINDTLKQVTLNAVNALRQEHQANNVTYDDTLAKGAQSWADSLAKSGILFHSNDPAYGENLAQVGAVNNQTRVIVESVKLWASERNNFTYGTNMVTSGLHFTALVWLNSKRIGLGIAKGTRGSFVVMRFTPPGNIGGQYIQNVLPPVALSPAALSPPSPTLKSPPPRPFPLTNPNPIPMAFQSPKAASPPPSPSPNPTIVIFRPPRCNCTCF